MSKIANLLISRIKPNEKNPRIIRDEKFLELVKSIKEFPEMLNLRPIVVNKDMIIIGGNMRYRACLEAGLKQVPVIVADKLTEKQQAEFIIKDNVSGGEWDYDLLMSEWETEDLQNWGIEVDFQIANTHYQAEVNPTTNYSDVTSEDVKKEAERLENQMKTENSRIECICPKCGTEFFIDR